MNDFPALEEPLPAFAFSFTSPEPILDSVFKWRLVSLCALDVISRLTYSTADYRVDEHPPLPHGQPTSPHCLVDIIVNSNFPETPGLAVICDYLFLSMDAEEAGKCYVEGWEVWRKRIASSTLRQMKGHLFALEPHRIMSSAGLFGTCSRLVMVRDGSDGAAVVAGRMYKLKLLLS
ncbi:hypothetical protein K440DRAFT_620182 [Wilcoxina mikolae CBS 423.85]|nr:hypothetical protein K440DRAFT_620182 [Wilcoxina mikolae CBS 423.85]